MSQVSKAKTKTVRCAVYTRVSTDAGLDQEFNSLDAQHDASSAYIRSQAHAGWAMVKSRYDDGGFSGGSTDRPALQRLLDDIRARRIDIIVVYKVTHVFPPRWQQLQPLRRLVAFLKSLEKRSRRWATRRELASSNPSFLTSALWALPRMFL